MEPFTRQHKGRIFVLFLWHVVKCWVLPFAIFCLFTHTILSLKEGNELKQMAYFNAFFHPAKERPQSLEDANLRYQFAKKHKKYFSEQEQILLEEGNLTKELKARVLKRFKKKYIESLMSHKKTLYHTAFFEEPISEEQDKLHRSIRIAFVNVFKNEFNEEEQELIINRRLPYPLRKKIFDLFQNQFMELP